MSEPQVSTPLTAPITPKVEPIKVVAKPKPAPKSVRGENFKPADQRRLVYVADADLTTKPDDVLKADYWTHVANQLRAGYRIEVRSEDLSWFMDLVVLRAEGNYVRVGEIARQVFTDNDSFQSPDGEYVIKWKGTTSLYGVQVRATGQWIKEKFSQRSEALSWLTDYLRMLKQ